MKIEKRKFLSTIKKANQIYIMGHRGLDLDALGSAVALAEIGKKYRKKTSIVVNDTHFELAVNQALTDMQKNVSFIKGKDVNISDRDLIIIVDTNKKEILQEAKLLEKTPHIMVIDHHAPTSDSINDGILFINEKASSTCEMIAFLLEDLKITLKEEINTLLLAGIVLDTNNFVVKTDEETYYSAYLLTKKGADPTKVQYLLKQDLREYALRQKVITNAKVYHTLAVTVGDENIHYRKEDLAKIADTLLQFKGVEASFVIGKLEKESIGVSARSMGNYQVGKIMEKMNGGGDVSSAATKIENSTLEEVEKKLWELIQ